MKGYIMKNMLLVLFLAIVASPVVAMHRFSNLWRTATPLVKTVVKPMVNPVIAARFTTTPLFQTAVRTSKSTAAATSAALLGAMGGLTLTNYVHADKDTSLSADQKLRLYYTDLHDILICVYDSECDEDTLQKIRKSDLTTEDLIPLINRNKSSDTEKSALSKQIGQALEVARQEKIKRLKENINALQKA